MKNKYERGLLFLLVLLLLFAGAFFLETEKTKKSIEEAERAEIRELESLVEEIEGLDIKAKAVSVFNITKHQKIYGRNDTEALPLASLVKTMTTIVALAEKEEQEVYISDDALAQTGDNSLYLYEKWAKEELLKFMLITSSNDAGVAISGDDPAFIDKMNEKAKRLGMTNTTFHNATGLDIDEERAGAYGSAEDANTMAIFAMRLNPGLFGTTSLSAKSFKSLSSLEHEAVNTNTSIQNLPGLMFSKTGATDLAGGNLTIIFKNQRGEEIAITVLGSTFLDRFKDIEQLHDVLYN